MYPKGFAKKQMINVEQCAELTNCGALGGGGKGKPVGEEEDVGVIYR